MSAMINETVRYPVDQMDDYEAKYKIREKHDSLLQMLKQFDAFCRKNGICYSLADGTLIGAMRHGGFIPWDDDADLMMTRKEYNKLREALHTDKTLHLFKIGCLDRVSFDGYLDQHLYMDLFVIDRVPVNERSFKLLRAKCGFLRGFFLNIYALGNSSHQEKYRNVVEPVLFRMARLYVGKRDVFDLYDSLFEKEEENAKFYTKFTSVMKSMNYRYPRQVFDEGYGDVLFRGEKLMAIRNADLFLRELYGDYMQLIPEEKRKPAHDIDMLCAPADCIKWYS